MSAFILAVLMTAGALAPVPDPTFKAQLERLSAEVQAQQEAQDQVFSEMRAQLNLDPKLRSPEYAPQGTMTAVTAQPLPLAKLSPDDEELLRQAAKHAHCATGKLVKDTDSPLWIPEMKANCR